MLLSALFSKHYRKLTIFKNAYQIDILIGVYYFNEKIDCEQDINSKYLPLHP